MDEELDKQEASSNDMQHTEQVTTVFEGDEDYEGDKFEFEELPIIEDNKLHEHDQPHSSNPSAALLHWHYRLGHWPFKTLQAMAIQDQLPKSLVTCKVLKCAACLSAGKATKQPW
jgi:GAG-pre-integrase domain